MMFVHLNRAGEVPYVQYTEHAAKCSSRHESYLFLSSFDEDTCLCWWGIGLLAMDFFVSMSAILNSVSELRDSILAPLSRKIFFTAGRCLVWPFCRTWYVWVEWNLMNRALGRQESKSRWIDVEMGKVSKRQRLGNRLSQSYRKHLGLTTGEHKARVTQLLSGVDYQICKFTTLLAKQLP